MSKRNHLSGPRLEAFLLALGLWQLSQTAFGQNAHYAYDASGNLAASTNISPSLAIVGQPATQLTQTGANSTFSVTIPNGASVLYQWRFNGANIAGATNDSLVLRNLSSTNLGNYTVIRPAALRD